MRQNHFFYYAKELGDDLRKYLAYFPDIQRALAKIFINKATFKNLNTIKDGLKIASMISELFRIKHSKLTDGINAIISQIFGYSQLVDQLEEALKQSEEDVTRPIRVGYNKQLDELYDIKDNSHQKISDMRDKYREKTGVANLKIVKNNIFGYFVEVTSMNASKMEQDFFVHKQTLGNVVRYFTDELKHLEDVLLNCDNKIESLEKHIFEKLCEQVKAHFDEINLVVTSIANLDLYSSLAELAHEKNYAKPQVHDGDSFEIEGGRHPVVENYQKDNFIPNSSNINEQEKIWLITGPNMAGKSTFLRQNALICILAQMGSYVPATKVNLGVVDKMFSRIGAADNLAKGESTFMVEMLETAYILNNATQKSFVILDEIGRGTSTHDGIAIAWAVLEYIHNKTNCRTLFATHYHELVQLKKHLKNIATYTMEIKEWNNEIIFMHKIRRGVADSSYGVHVAQLAGLPTEVIKIAQNILSRFENAVTLDVQKEMQYTANTNSTASKESEIVEMLKHVDMNSTTLLKAHEILCDLKKKL
ncbi:DNA mismatch repair protein MutS [Candidatus Bandiella euplotis]|uniref:DNA mismatch repair protein MutS C-terminal domain protein n=1 Tax=Candidatus Bandiella euplotis TaxID=1664265 RepID=A0ABZ0UQI8_9RICK|nr:DNA mismatch repair protein MutS [Candidatus Bandiella woodruffii]WPX97289.1 DNA mismatch repair protein MutS C-terminal domain protein [Candidatus Bandiella woodruffii]